MRKSEQMMDAFIMQMLGETTTFDMFAQAMVYVRAAAEAGGAVNMFLVNQIEPPFGGGTVTNEIFENEYLTVFGDIEPWPEEKENPTPEEHKAFLEAERNFVQNFTLNENGWKFAEHIKQLWDAMKDIVPTQEQLDQWNQEYYKIRKKKMIAENEQKFREGFEKMDQLLDEK